MRTSLSLSLEVELVSLSLSSVLQCRKYWTKIMNEDVVLLFQCVCILYVVLYFQRFFCVFFSFVFFSVSVFLVSAFFLVSALFLVSAFCLNLEEKLFTCTIVWWSRLDINTSLGIHNFFAIISTFHLRALSNPTRRDQWRIRPRKMKTSRLFIFLKLCRASFVTFHEIRNYSLLDKKNMQL